MFCSRIRAVCWKTVRRTCCATPAVAQRMDQARAWRIRLLSDRTTIYGSHIDFHKLIRKQIMVYADDKSPAILYEAQDRWCDDHPPRSRRGHCRRNTKPPTVSFLKGWSNTKRTWHLRRRHVRIPRSAARTIPAANARNFEQGLPLWWLGFCRVTKPVNARIDFYASSETRLRPCLYAQRNSSEPVLHQVPPQRTSRWSDGPSFGRRLSNGCLSPVGQRWINGPSNSKNPSRRCGRFVDEPLPVGNLFSGGDAAHYRPPDRAKGLTLRCPRLFSICTTR